MQRDHVGPFELMFNIQLGKAILAFLSLVIFNEVNYFLRRETVTGTFDEATTLGDIDNLEFQMVLPAAPDEAAGKRKLADLESRL